MNKKDRKIFFDLYNTIEAKRTIETGKREKAERENKPNYAKVFKYSEKLMNETLQLFEQALEDTGTPIGELITQIANS